jgi:hypothetical protein
MVEMMIDHENIFILHTPELIVFLISKRNIDEIRAPKFPHSGLSTNNSLVDDFFNFMTTMKTNIQ